jgi:hypothetical protein
VRARAAGEQAAARAARCRAPGQHERHRDAGFGSGTIVSLPDWKLRIWFSTYRTSTCFCWLGASEPREIAG